MTVIILQVVALAVLAVGSIGLAAVEAAFYLVKRRRLSHLALHNPRAEMVNRYLDDPPTLLMPVHMGTYTAHLAMTVVITSLFLGIGSEWALLIAFLSMVVYLLLFRLSVPYTLVRRNPERSLLLLMPVFHPYALALSPLVAALRKRAASATTQGYETLRLKETQPVEVPPPPVQEEDEGRLIDAVTRFSVTQVRDVMTPRPDIVAMPASGKVGDLRRIMRETKYSRIPLYGENLDDIVGVVTVRDVVEYEGGDEDPLQPLVRPALVVPETKKIAELLKEMQAGRVAFAVAIDEYGGTAGLLSVEDIVEEIVGEIKDEYDTETEPISVEPDGAVLVAGRVNLERLEQALEVPLGNGERVATVGGLVASVFGRIPRPGERTDYRGYSLEVVDAEHKRVNRVRFRRKTAEAAS
ncbi:MAG TPA: hemolysin family protein [Vicinamibacteria bacterium]|nr:hemolysin family protein [Vicinamibacteria bacterium]